MLIELGLGNADDSFHFFDDVPDEDEPPAFDWLAGFFRSVVMRCRSKSVVNVIVTEAPAAIPRAFP